MALEGTLVHASGIEGDRVSRVCHTARPTRCHSFVPSGLLKRLYFVASSAGIPNP
jgi:hypothetical protein